MSGALRRAVDDVVRVLNGAPRLVHVFPSTVAQLLVSPEKLRPIEALEALDELGFTLRRSRLRAEITPALDAARAALSPALHDVLDAGLLPDLGPLPRDMSFAWSKVKVTAVPWPAPERTVVALERRGHLHNRYACHVHVASGEPRSTRLDVLEAALIAIEAASPGREDHSRLLRLIDDSERDDPRANSEAAVRFAVACIERARAIAKAREVALAFLAGAGITPIALAAGERFDPEKHPASAFERKRGPGPAGRVVVTEVTGFRDAKGVVLSRALVSVGEG